MSSLKPCLQSLPYKTYRARNLRPFQEAPSEGRDFARGLVEWALSVWASVSELLAARNVGSRVYGRVESLGFRAVQGLRV